MQSRLRFQKMCTQAGSVRKMMLRISFLSVTLLPVYQLAIIAACLPSRRHGLSAGLIFGKPDQNLGAALGLVRFPEDWQFRLHTKKFEGRWRQWLNAVERTHLLPFTTPWQRGI